VITMFLALCIGADEAALTPARNGTLVEIAECQISWWPWDDVKAIHCNYRIDEGEWKHIQSSKAPEYPELFLPGTSVHLAVIDGYFYAQADEDVRELRWVP
jgi:hypothetical protein